MSSHLLAGLQRAAAANFSASSDVWRGQLVGLVDVHLVDARAWAAEVLAAIVHAPPRIISRSLRQDVDLGAWGPGI